MREKKEKAKRPRSDSMKWIYGLLTVCLLFLVACDNQSSKNNETNKEKSSNVKTTEEDTNEVKTKEEKRIDNKTVEKNKAQNNKSIENNEKQSVEEIPVEENVNGVKPNNHTVPEEFDTKVYNTARNCLLNQGNSQAECDDVESTIEFTRAWQNLSHDGYLCNDDGCTLPKDDQHQDNSQQSDQDSNYQTDELNTNENNHRENHSNNNNQQYKDTNKEQQKQNQSNETTNENANNQENLNKAS